MTTRLRLQLQQLLSTQERMELLIEHVQQVFGGDINDTYVLATNKGKIFCKLNSITAKDMFEKEYSGFMLLRTANALPVPEPILHGEYEDYLFLLMEFIEEGQPAADCWQQFGHGLAGLHRSTQKYFGLDQDNYIGHLQQQNTLCSTWADFFTTQRIMPLFKKALEQNKCSLTDLKMAENLCKKLNELFPAEPPALLHGDLWNGNYRIGKNGYAAIYDPSVYYGHREMDIGMTLLFGGFDAALYDHYNEVYPLERGWKKRIALCQLFPLLVHLVLFGGQYHARVKATLQQYQ